MRALLFLALSLTLAAPAAALQRPSPHPTDPRIKTFRYDANEVFELAAHYKYVTSIQFGAGERIESVQLGDSESWQVVRLKRGDVLSIKPVAENASTNMVVHTDRRVYAFDLKGAWAKPGSSRLSYRVGFTYPDETIAAAAKIEPSLKPGDFADYHATGDEDFRPVEAWDDGVSTYFRFAPGARRPSVFRTDADGRDAVVNLTAHGETLIQIHGVNDRWTLRLGEATTCVFRGEERAVAAKSSNENAMMTAEARDHD